MFEGAAAEKKTRGHAHLAHSASALGHTVKTQFPRYPQPYPSQPDHACAQAALLFLAALYLAPVQSVNQFSIGVISYGKWTAVGEIDLTELFDFLY